MKINKPKVWQLFAISGALLATACTQTQNVLIEPQPVCDFNAFAVALAAPGPVLVPQVPGTITEIPLNAVNITDNTLTNKIIVQATNAKRAENGAVQVWARIVNCTDFPLQVEGRTHFLDLGQAAVEPVTAWNRIFLQAKSITTYSTVSTTLFDAESYLIELREGR